MAVPTRRTVVGPVVPSRGAITFAWAMSAAVFAAGFIATLIVSMLLIAPVGMRPDPTNPLGVQWDTWASWVCLGLSMLVGTLMATAGRGSGGVWAWADLRVLDGRGEVAGWPRRSARPLLLSAVVIASMAIRHDLLGVVLGVGLVLLALVSSLAATDRRGVVERLLGIRDVAWGQVPAPDDVPTTA
jgi:hypothetical protein